MNTAPSYCVPSCDELSFKFLSMVYFLLYLYEDVTRSWKQVIFTLVNTGYCKIGKIFVW